MTEAEIDQRLAALVEAETGEGPAGGNQAPSPAPLPTYIRPLSDVADSLIESLHVEEGINLGLPEIDVLTRGFRAGELVLITGFAHSGKSQLINTMLLNNVEYESSASVGAQTLHGVLYFSLDEPAELVLCKLAAMWTQTDGQVLEKHLALGDEDSRLAIKDVAQNKFKNLLIVDDVIDLDAMDVAIAEATEYWGAPPKAVIVDYAELVPEGSSDVEMVRVKQLMNKIKAKAKPAPYPTIVVHQGTRSNAQPGEPITQTSLSYGGEQQASIILGVRRKRDLKALSDAEKRAHEDTVSVHVVKNKKPGGRSTRHDGVDFFLQPENGLIRPLSESERRRLYEPQSATAVAHRASTQTRWELP